MRARTPAGSATGSRPKTRTDPVSAFSKPSTCLMSVVLPAPLAPTRPSTMPRGSVKLTLSSAVMAPKRRVKALTSTTGSANAGLLAIMGFTAPRGRGAVAWPHRAAHECDDLVQADVQLARFGKQRVDAFRHDPHAFTPCERRAIVRHERARRPAFDDNARRLQLAIRARDRVRVDEQTFGQHADGRHFLARRQPARRDQVLHLIDDLQVDRHAVVRGNVEVQGILLPFTERRLSRLSHTCTNSIIQIAPWKSSAVPGDTYTVAACLLSQGKTVGWFAVVLSPEALAGCRRPCRWSGPNWWGILLGLHSGTNSRRGSLTAVAAPPSGSR